MLRRFESACLEGGTDGPPMANSSVPAMASEQSRITWASSRIGSRRQRRRLSGSSFTFDSAPSVEELIR